jgi:hypothetical protein
MLQLSVGAAYWYTGYSTLQSCRHTNFLSLDSGSGLCTAIEIGIQDTFYIDDTGYWDTSYSWAFANTMVSSSFQGFYTTEERWRSKYAIELYNQISTWNTQWGTQPTVDNLMAMVVSEYNIAKSGILSVNIVADPNSLMASDFQDAVGYNGLFGGSVLPFTYQDKGNEISLSASSDEWTTTFPKWKFGLQNDDGATRTSNAISLNKYSMWVAAAVNLGVISIVNLTNLKSTSLASIYGTVSDDTSDSGGTTLLPYGLTCVNPSGFEDGWCDVSNNVAACNFDGGDCCESTCGNGYVVGVECGSNGFDSAVSKRAVLLNH